MRGLLLWVLLAASCTSPFPIRTCMQAKRAITDACGFTEHAAWTCWDEPTLRGAGTALPEPLFACLDGATTCFEVESCLRNQGLLPDPAAPHPPATNPTPGTPDEAGPTP